MRRNFLASCRCRLNPTYRSFAATKGLAMGELRLAA